MQHQKQPEQLQEFNFNICLKVSGDTLEKHDLKSIMHILCKAELYDRNWTIDVPGKKAKQRYDCVICQGNIEKGQILYETKCKHIYHKKCLFEWFEKGNKTFHPTCPICRTNVTVKFKQENVYDVHSTYSLVGNTIELERTIQRKGSTYIRYHDI